MKRAVHNCFTAEHDDAAQVKIEHIMHQTKQDEFVTVRRRLPSPPHVRHVSSFLPSSGSSLVPPRAFGRSFFLSFFPASSRRLPFGSKFWKYLQTQAQTPDAPRCTLHRTAPHRTAPHRTAQIELWDMPSREDYDTRDVSYTGIGASLVMVDLTNLQTLDNARLWRTDTLAVAREDEAMAARRRSMRRQTIADDFVTWGDEGGSRDVTSADAPAYLVATKADMIGTVDEMNALVQECEQVRDTAGFNGLLIVSAKDDMRHSVKKAIDSVAAALCASDDYAQEAAANAKAAAKAGANAA